MRTATPPDDKHRPKQRREHSDAPTVVLHWAFVVAMLASLVTGLRISADRLDSGWAGLIAPLLPQGDVFRWHVWFGYAIGLLSIAYIVYLVRARVRGRISLHKAREQVRSLPSDSPGIRKRQLRLWNVVVYWAGFVLLFVSVLTGVVHYLLPRFVPHEPLLTAHRIAAWSVLVYIVVHVSLQIAHGGIPRLLKIFRPRPRHGLAASVALLAAVAGGMAIYLVERASLPTLDVAVVDSGPRLDGRINDPIWEVADDVVIHTVRGANHDDGETTIEVSAVHDAKHLYTLFRWRDDTRSQQHLPLVKTDRGWRVQQSDYDRQDEVDFYEDKFAVMWDSEPANAAAATVHLGERPLSGKPGAPGERGLHYTTDGGVVDVWHWKSVRTGTDVTAQMDDNFFGPPLPVDPEASRYTGGYSKDPADGGGYEMNWESFDVGTITPKRLPRSIALLTDRTTGEPLDPERGDQGDYWLHVDETVPYDVRLDASIPVGTVMPSVLIDEPHHGDRGDVSAVARWQDGWWQVETRRALDTGSEYDIPFVPGESVYLWLAAFDHSQTRHSYHLRPIEVRLQSIPSEKAVTTAANHASDADRRRSR